MLLTKMFSGTLESVGSTSSRIRSYGNTTTLSAYWNKIDFVNQTIADFLSQDCGVDAAYESRYDSAKFLWIFGLPYLIVQSSTSSNNWYGYGPYTSTVIGSSSVYATFFSGSTTAIYSFSLSFVGNPSSAFCLRFKNYNSTSINNSFVLKFIKCTNILNSRDAVVWIQGTSANAIDLSSEGSPVAESFSGDAQTYYVYAPYKSIYRTNNAGRFPLIPVMFGPYKPLGVYQYISNFQLPAECGVSSEIQTVIEINGRKFIQTGTSNSTASSYINLGLIEIDE